jgi:hypothetical protein
MSKELLQEFETAPAPSTPVMLSRKEQFEKEVAVAREELRMKRIVENESRVEKDVEKQGKDDEELQALDWECGDFWGDEVNAEVCQMDFGLDLKTEEGQKFGTAADDKK